MMKLVTEFKKRQRNKRSWTVSNVVGVVDSPRAIAIASRMKSATVDFLEWRADCLPGITLPKVAAAPWIVTARHPMEGGQGGLSSSARRGILLGLIDGAKAVDVECRSLGALREVVEAAHTRRVDVIASFHDFRRTPSVQRLREVLKGCVDGGADVVKIATRTESADDVRRLLELFGVARIPLAVMGMGPLGMASRLLFGSCGSVLNYGWLDRPNVPGQWSAKDLKAMLATIREQN